MRRRVTVVPGICHISPLARLFVLNIMSHTQRATKVKIFWVFSLKPLRCRNQALPLLKAIRRVGHFSANEHYSHVEVRREFCTLEQLHMHVIKLLTYHYINFKRGRKLNKVVMHLLAYRCRRKKLGTQLLIGTYS